MKMNRKKDKAIFRKTQKLTRKINVAPRVKRGGICL